MSDISKMGESESRPESGRKTEKMRLIEKISSGESNVGKTLKSIFGGLVAGAGLGLGYLAFTGGIPIPPGITATLASGALQGLGRAMAAVEPIKNLFNQVA